MHFKRVFNEQYFDCNTENIEHYLMSVLTFYTKILTYFFQLNILLNGNVVEELGTIVHASKAVSLGRKMVLKLVDMIPRQMFQVI